MRIGIDARLWNESGVGRYTRNLVAQLQILDKKNEYALFILSKDYEDIKLQVGDKWKLVKADIRWHTIAEQLRFPFILNKEQLDLVHFPYFSVPLFYNKPFVVTIHDVILHHFPTGQASTLPLPFYLAKLTGYKFIIKQAVQKAKKIITVSQATKKEIVDKLKVNEDKVIVTYEGVGEKPNTKFKAENSKFKLKTKSYFLYVGNAYPHKNLERLIEAFALLCHPEHREGSHFVRDSSAKPQNDIRLLLVGKEDYFYNRLRKKVQAMKLENSVIFYGYATEEELIYLYENAKALVMPSLMEGFGLPVLEAMANNCLVLASDIPALKEIAGDAALYFDPLSREDIKNKLQAVQSHDIHYYRDILKKGLHRSKTFSWEKMAKETLVVYKHAVEG